MDPPELKLEKKKQKAPEPHEIKWTNKCYGYIRVSTKHQAKEGLSLESQEEKIRAWAIMADHKILKIYSDAGFSGTTRHNRKQLELLLDTITTGQTLVTYSFSRLSRSARDFLNIIHSMEMRGCRVVIINEGLDTKTAYGKFTATMFSAVAQLEADIISQRVQDAMDVKKAKGEFVGRIPYGWKLSDGKGSNLTEIPEEQVVISKIKELRSSFTIDGKQYSYDAIADFLNRNAIKPPSKSSQWTYTNVRRIHIRKEVKTKGRPPERRSLKDDASKTYSSDEEEEEIINKKDESRRDPAFRFG